MTALALLGPGPHARRLRRYSEIDTYDSIVSVFNVMTVGCWCCATALRLATFPIASLLHDR